MAMLFLIAFALTAVNAHAWDSHDNSKNGKDTDNGCSNQTLNGDYGLTIEGLLDIPGNGIPVRGVVHQHYDGNGHLTQVDHVVVGGTAPSEAWRPGSGTYDVNSDCTGKATINIPSSQGQPPLVLYFVIVKNGKEIRQVVDGNAIVATGSKVE
jgi:hypothetical protein